ncbi:MAG: DUF1330 domain-containing protein [Bacteroidota bacterium]
MDNQKLYLTLLLFIKEGEEANFQAYEAQVLPLLSQYNGQLVYRVRPTADNFIQPAEELPYEIHLVSFDSRQDFDNYKQDEERKKHAPLFQQSIQKVLLIEGFAL